MSALTLRVALIAWCCLETGLAVHNRIARRRGIVHDRSSLPILLAAIALGFWLASSVRGIAGMEIDPAKTWTPHAAAILVISGLVIRVHAVAALRGFFTTTVILQSHHRLVRRGLYAHIRHPGYLGILLIFTGLGLCFRNALSLLVLLGVVLPAVFNRIHVEESALAARFGDEYAEYSKVTKRLIPFLC